MEDNRPKSKWPWVLALILILVVGYFLWSKYKTTPQVLPGSNGTSANSETTNPRPGTLPPGVQGEFGDEVSNPPVQAPVPPKKITLSGKYIYSEDIKSQAVGKVCFTPDVSAPSSVKQFCFNNGDEVFAIFGLQRGFSDGSKQCTVSAKATIEIKDYTKLTADVGGYDSATLTKVISSGTQTFSACQK